MNWTFCSTDKVLPAGYQVLLQWIAERWTMDANGFSVVDNRAGITFGVELYVSCGGALCRGAPSGRARIRT